MRRVNFPYSELGCSNPGSICSSARHVAAADAPQAATAGRVELYVADQAGPTRPFYELAIVQAIGFVPGFGARRGI